MKIILYCSDSSFGSIEVFQYSDFEPNKPYCTGFIKEQMNKFNKRS
jgi:hypothetical protein